MGGEQQLQPRDQTVNELLLSGSFGSASAKNASVHFKAEDGTARGDPLIIPFKASFIIHSKLHFT